VFLRAFTQSHDPDFVDSVGASNGQQFDSIRHPTNVGTHLPYRSGAWLYDSTFLASEFFVDYLGRSAEIAGRLTLLRKRLTHLSSQTRRTPTPNRKSRINSP